MIDRLSDDGIDVRVEAGIARITLDRPAAGNAITLPVAMALMRAAIRCETDPLIRCVIMTGRGRLFCAGGDVPTIADAGAGRATMLAELIGVLHVAIERLSAMPKPLITLINGPAAGAGFSLAMLGDLVLSARSAHFTAAYGAIGLTADGGLSWLLPRLVGLRRAQEIVLTNRRISALEAETIGLVTRVVEDDALAEEGNKLAEQLAGGATRALGAARALLRHSFDTGLEAQLNQEQRSMVLAGGSAECAEGLQAFLAKRPANFKGI